MLTSLYAAVMLLYLPSLALKTQVDNLELERFPYKMGPRKDNQFTKTLSLGDLPKEVLVTSLLHFCCVGLFQSVAAYYTKHKPESTSPQTLGLPEGPPTQTLNCDA